MERLLVLPRVSGEFAVATHLIQEATTPPEFPHCIAHRMKPGVSISVKSTEQSLGNFSAGGTQRQITNFIGRCPTAFASIFFQSPPNP